MRYKCFGLFLVLCTIFGLSLSVCSDTNALRYEVTTIPFGQPQPNSDYYYYGTQYTFFNPFSFTISSEYSADFYNIPYYYNLYLSGNECVYDSRAGNARPGSIISENGSSLVSYTYSFPYYDDRFVYDFTDYANIVSCNKNGAISNINSVSLPAYIFGNPNYQSFPPYRYNYNGIYAHSYSTTEGLHTENRFNFAELFASNSSTSLPWGNLPSRFESITIPLGLFTNVSDVSHGSSVVIHGRFMFDSENPETDVLTLDNDFAINSTYHLIFEDEGKVSGSASNVSTCTYNLIDNRSNTDEMSYFLEFTCPITLDLRGLTLDPEHGSLGFDVSFGGFTYNNMADFILNQFYVITNGIDTPASSSFTDYSITGNDSNNAPGSADFEYDSNVNWFASLTNLFNFTLANPFSPIFGMFTNNSQCASIPTIAGMLGTNETTYCPWFPSSVRTILTPVLGLSSVMLLFGFFVRWLSSSSGNMFEDQTTHKWGNTQIKQGGK